MRLTIRAFAAAVVLCLAPGLALAGGRVALVVANASYPSAPLSNPATDSQIVASSLRSIGFDVDVVTDANLATFDGALTQFGTKASGADIALFYFAGHGFAVSDGLKPRNYLLSVEADVASRSDRVLRAGGIPLDEIVSGLTGKAKATLVFIDACRNDPKVSRAIGGTGRGLARLDLDASANVFVGLSTRLGTVAGDGKPGEGSPFARAFAAKMILPGQRLDDAFTEVRKAVAAETNREQQPEVVQNDLDQAMVLVSATAPPPANPDDSKVNKPDPRLAEAAQIWPGIENSANLTTLTAFRDRFAGTFYADLAAARIAELQKDAGTDQAKDTQKLSSLDVPAPLDVTPAPQPGTSIALAGHSEMVREIAFTPDGKLIASVSNDRTVKLWDGFSGKEIRSFATDNYLVAISADGRLIASGNQDTIEIHDIASGELTAALPADKFDFVSVAFSPDGSLLAGGGFGLDDNAIRVFDIAQQKRIRIIKGNTNTVQRVAFLPDGRRLLADSADKSIRIFDVTNGRQLMAIKLPTGAGGVQSTEISPDGALIASGTVKTILRLWNARTGKLVTEWNADPDNVATLAWAPNGRIIAYAGGPGGAIHLWNPQTQRVVATLEGHSAPVNTLAFSRDGTRLVSGASDGSVRLWTLDGNVMAAQ